MRQQEAAFIGKMTAHTTHEFMNVLAVIRETSGLMEDLLALSGDASLPYHEKLSKTLTTIARQVSRGMKISAMLNKFAHSMEEGEAWVEVNDLLDQLSILMQRSTGLKQVNLTIGPLESPMDIRIDPFRLQWILVTCLEHCLDRTARGGVVTLQSHRREKGIAIQCMMEPGLTSKEHIQEILLELEAFQDTLRALNGQLVPITQSGRQGLEIILPLETK